MQGMELNMRNNTVRLFHHLLNENQFFTIRDLCQNKPIDINKSPSENVCIWFEGHQFSVYDWTNDYIAN